MMKIQSPLCHTTDQLLFKVDFKKKVDQLAGGKWLIHDTKRKGNQLQSLKLPRRIS